MRWSQVHGGHQRGLVPNSDTQAPGIEEKHTGGGVGGHTQENPLKTPHVTPPQGVQRSARRMQEWGCEERMFQGREQKLTLPQEDRVEPGAGTHEKKRKRKERMRRQGQHPPDTGSRKRGEDASRGKNPKPSGVQT